MGVALMLAGCGSAGQPAATAPATGPGSSEPPAATATTEAPATTPEVAPERAACERAALQITATRSPVVATAEDLAAVEAAIGTALPGEPECSIAYDVEGKHSVLTVWVADPSVAPALVETLSTDRFKATKEPGAGYTISVFTDGELVVSVAPVKPGPSAWSQPWPDDEVTLLFVNLP